MSDLPETLDIPVWGTAGRIHHFERTEDIVTWAEEEVKNWTFERKPKSQGLLSAMDHQRNSLSQIATQARHLESSLKVEQPWAPPQQQQVNLSAGNLRQTFVPITQGMVLTAEHPTYRFIAKLVEKDPDAAAVLVLASRSDGTQALANVRGGSPLDAIARVAAGLAEIGDDSRDITAYRGQLALINNDSEKALSAVRDTLNQEAARSKQIEREHAGRVENQQKEWITLLKKCETDWNELNRVYDEKLSLAAPTNYWTKQAEQYRNQGISYAVAFVAVLMTSIVLFATFGIAELKQLKPPGTSVVVAILPVIVPGFAGIWVLRILGRQLAESLAIMKDAKERVTLVKTFLALMRDESAGKAVVKEEDRALILHALFRQSRVTAVDDSPPLNALDSIMKHMKQS